MSNTIQKAFDPTSFRKAGHELIDLLADHLQNSIHGKTSHSQKWQSPSERIDFWEKEIAKEDFDLADFTQKILDQSLHLHHPKYIGHQVGIPAPIAALMGLLSNLINNGMAIYEVGQAAVSIEHLVIKQITDYFGFGDQAGGLLTSGGTLGNLTALLTARNTKTIIEKVEVTQQLAVMVSEEAHYCVERAVQTMGLGEQGIIKVPVDENFRMCTDLLEPLLEKAQSQQIQVFAVVGSACSTSTGSFDDLEAIARFCQKYQLWFHVDGAHGAAAIFSDCYKYLVKGIEQADSFIMDFHKMLLTPALTTGLFYKNVQHSYQTFAQKAQYLWSAPNELEWYNIGKRSYECTKLMMSLRVYSILKTQGMQLWSDYINQTFNLAKSFADLLQRSPDFELATMPSCNIVCFRYLGADNLNELNNYIRQQILEAGEFYIVKTTLKDQVYLRTTLMNPFTRLEDLELLLRRVRSIARAALLKTI
ncbi:MAG: aminotransferase class I/II-fold pyridoxal phosphate-dependent enzyme [Bacteroidota bacterium]